VSGQTLSFAVAFLFAILFGCLGARVNRMAVNVRSVGRLATLVLLTGQLLLPHAAEAKVQRGTVRMGGSDEASHFQYVSKFGYQVGQGKFEVKARLLGEPLPEGKKAPIDFQVYLDEDWELMQSISPCDRQNDKRSKQNRQLDLLSSQAWNSVSRGTLNQKVRPHIWYFVFSSCRGKDEGEQYDIEYELNMKQFDDSEFSIEMRPMLLTHMLVLLGLTAFLARFASRCQHFLRTMGSMHPVICTLVVAVVLQWTAQAFHTSHLWRFRADGEGMPAVDMLSEVLFMLSQVVISTMLIAIAQGYTLVTSHGDELSVIKPVAAVVAIIHVALVFCDNMQGEASDKHHENAGSVGWVLLAIRLGLFAWFKVGTGALQRNASFKLQNFLQIYHLAGSLYFLAYPVFLVLVQVFAPYLRHTILQMGLLTMQTCSSFWLADLFLSRGMYHDISALGSSCLPGGHSGGSSWVVKQC
jgi:hypothetical protein